jgi:hypothetical protein
MVTDLERSAVKSFLGKIALDPKKAPSAIDGAKNSKGECNYEGMSFRHF